MTRDVPRTRSAVDASQDWASFLSGVLGEQRDLCRTLAAMCEQQGVLVRTGDSDGLMRVLSHRQALIDRISELSDLITPYRATWESRVLGIDPSKRRELESAIEEITSLIEQIGRQDDADRAALESQRATLSRELEGINRGRGAIGAYSGASGAGSAGPRFQDCNG
ncbi:MAG: flagellar export chaperone FlgN [Phycisphaerales bacterium]